MRALSILISAAALSVFAQGCVIKKGADSDDDGGFDFSSGDTHDCDNNVDGGDADPIACAGDADCEVGSYCDTAAADPVCTASATCSAHADCGAGFICDASGTCVPGELGCADIEDEATCAQRADCEPVYAGVDCSCGADCECVGGEPGCVCESFEFFQCEGVETE